MDIQYWSDYACPFCYIGITNLKNALKELNMDVPVEMLSFELDPDPERPLITDLVGFFADKYGISREEAMKRIDGIHSMAKEAGLSFDYTGVQKSSTLNAHRLTKKAAETGLAEKANQVLYSAYFDRHLNLNDPQVLKELGTEIGLDEKEVKDLLNDERECLQDVRFDEAMAAQAGVTGVPFFVINRQLAIPGAISKEQWMEILPQIVSQQG